MANSLGSCIYAHHPRRLCSRTLLLLLLHCLDWKFGNGRGRWRKNEQGKGVLSWNIGGLEDKKLPHCQVRRVAFVRCLMHQEDFEQCRSSPGSHSMLMWISHSAHLCCSYRCKLNSYIVLWGAFSSWDPALWPDNLFLLLGYRTVH